MKKILALTAAAVLAVSSIGCTKHEGGSEPAPPTGGAAPTDANKPPEGGAPAPADGGVKTEPAPETPAPEGKAP